MISISRLLAALAITVFASACSGAPSDTTDDPSGVSADELSKARFTQLKSGPTNAKLAALFAAGNKIDTPYVGVYRFNKPGVEKTDADARMKRIKEVMHRYMCSFFDESIDLGRATGSKRVSVTLSDVDLDNNASGQDAQVAAFSSALTQVFNDSKLDVMSGSASGNNTGGEVMGIYDITHNEVFFFGFTNCGSDD